MKGFAKLCITEALQFNEQTMQREAQPNMVISAISSIYSLTTAIPN
jgi:hypothetical protein